MTLHPSADNPLLQRRPFRWPTLSAFRDALASGEARGFALRMSGENLWIYYEGRRVAYSDGGTDLFAFHEPQPGELCPTCGRR